LTNSAPNLVNSAAHRGKADDIPRLTAFTQLNFRGLIKSWINRSNKCFADSESEWSDSWFFWYWESDFRTPRHSHK